MHYNALLPCKPYAERVSDSALTQKTNALPMHCNALMHS